MASSLDEKTEFKKSKQPLGVAEHMVSRKGTIFIYLLNFRKIQTLFKFIL
jgi:hypothetical protein